TLRIDVPKPEKGLSVGFGKVNITPAAPVATAGYGTRRGKPYERVHDSIYVRSMVIENGSQRVAVVSADLLIIPPTVTRALEAKLRSIGFSLDNTYLGATHSHNSIGHWGEGATRFIYGKYEDSVVQLIADAIVESIRLATSNRMPSTLRHGAVAIPEAVQNRLIDGGIEDPYLRAVEVRRSDSSKLVMATYDAHATCLSQRTLELSRDYPGMVVDELESKGYDFAMFMAGAVGSHKGSAPGDDWDCMAWMADRITDRFLEARDSLKPVEGAALAMKRVALPLGDPQVKISDDWKLRAWLFRSAFGEYDHFLTVLRIGDVVMLGTPCDFSGEFDRELDSLAEKQHMQAIVTSFNGGYIGYVTPAKYYDINHYETRLMNWYAPGTGEYILESLEKLMAAVSDTR
ncbi:MAG TPA: neutral/alkaline non-lysosomal ceramidase N-terminal domain-containing protein, partial [Chryseosolibacter sp.]